jgi:hypothetical protein
MNVTPQGFLPNQTLTRAEAASVLAGAFHLLPSVTDLDRRWGPEAVATARFKDVPVYARTSAAVEALAEAKAVRPCAESKDRFCPDDVETVSGFIYSIEALKRRIHPESGLPSSRSAITDSTADDRKPAAKNLTRIEAATLLYSYLDPSR